MTVQNLAIPYSDFKLQEIIDPEQFDLNNADIVSKMNEVITAFNNANDTEIPALKTRATNLESRATNLESRATSLETRVTANESNISSNATNLTNHKSSTDHDSRYYTKSQVDVKVFSTSNIADKSITANKIADSLLENNVAISSHRLQTVIDHPDKSVTFAKLADAVVDYIDNSGVNTADAMNITDVGNYFTSSYVEGALQEIGQTLNSTRGSLVTSANNILGA